MGGNLDTTNVLLAVMAGVSVVEALLLIGMGIGGFLIYGRVMRLVTGLEARQIAPLREKVDAILVDVKAVTARVSEQTARVDHAISGTMERVDETAGRVKDTVADKVNQVVAVAHGVRAAIVSVAGGEARRARRATAESRF